MQENEAIRCMKLPLAEDWLLLPNVSVAEVIAFVEPKELNQDEASCLIGNIDWRGVSVPVLSFEKACLLTEKEDSIRDRIAIIYNPNGDEKKPYVGVKLIDIPRSFRAETDNLIEEEISPEQKQLIKFQLSFEEQRLFVPDLDALFDQLH